MGHRRRTRDPTKKKRDVSGAIALFVNGSIAFLKSHGAAMQRQDRVVQA